MVPWANTFDNVYLPLRLQDQDKAAVSDQVNEVLEPVGP